MPIMTSLSTRFLGQPRLTNPIFFGAVGAILSGPPDRATESSWGYMKSLYFSIFHRLSRDGKMGSHDRAWARIEMV
jgi:hypothetical protein